MCDKVDAFKAWFIKGGGEFGEHVEVHYDSQRNVHLRVAQGQTLKSGSCILSCPHALTLSVYNVLEGSSALCDDLHSLVTNDANSISSLSLLRFFLIEQYHLGIQSFWWPYINLLPDPYSEPPFNTPLYYNGDDLKWIRGTSLEHSRRKTEELWKDEHAQGLRVFRQTNSVNFPWELYKWAATVISSRSFPSSALESGDAFKKYGNLEAPPVLLPGLDLLNHNPTTRVTWQWTGNACCINTDLPLSAGPEIFNNYAPKSNEELIMGYGFSLFRNPSDHCNLALGAMAVARIKHVANQRKLASVSTDRSESKDLSDKPMIANKSKNGMPPGPFRSGIGWVRLVSYSHAGFSLEPKAPSFMFSEGFLQQASIAFFNIREEQTAIPISDADVCSPTLTRNKLHTVCAIAMMLQKQCSDIIAGNSSLPVWPRNQRQFYAARYRRGQLRILRSVSGSMIGSLRRIVGLTSSLPRDRRIMRLEHILKAAPKEFLQDFRAAIHVALGTRDAKKIRQQNLTESAFTLWLCGLWLWSLPITDSDSKRRNRPSLPTRTEDWVAFVDTTYSDHSVIGKRWARIPASEEGQLLAESHHSIVKAAAAKNPQSIYGHPEATTDRLLWCLRVIREESLVCPNLEGEVEDQADEIVLFLESGDAPL